MKSSIRNREIARIHCAAKDLGLDDDAYRDLLQRVTGKRSAAELSQDERRRVLDDLRLKGAQRTEDHQGRPHNIDEQPYLQKIEALLADSKLSWAYADAIARRMFGKQRMAFCSEEQMRAVMVALMQRANKESASKENE